MPMPIGDLSDAARVKVPTIRYYEQIGLLPAQPRTRSNRRLYGPADVQRLTFIRHARELGFEIDAIRALLTLQDDPAQPCASADAIARARLGEVEARMAALRALKAELERMIEGCRHGRVAECRVIEVLADHEQCLHEHVGEAKRVTRPSARASRAI
jgi:DNA-binding transcriptional MerR regulator